MERVAGVDRHLGEVCPGPREEHTDSVVKHKVGWLKHEKWLRDAHCLGRAWGSEASQ